MLELFGLMVAGFVLAPIAIAIALAAATLCGVGHVLAVVWDLAWGGFGLVFGLLFVLALAAGALLLMFAAVLF